jgi:hypothetical protein
MQAERIVVYFPKQSKPVALFGALLGIEICSHGELPSAAHTQTHRRYEPSARQGQVREEPPRTSRTVAT